jgi:hypothetical protein
VLFPAWSDDLKAFVKSWETEDTWLDSSEPIHRERWQKSRYLNLHEVIGERLFALPADLSRRDIFRVAQSATEDPVEAFVWTMAWGHNGNNLGARRTDSIVGENGAIDRITGLIEHARKGDVEGAFRGLHDEEQFNLKGLSTSFGSKLIYFTGFRPNSSGEQPLILDALVANALREVVNPASGSRSSWSSATEDWDDYSQYCQVVRQIRDIYVPGYRADMVEHWLWGVGRRWPWHHHAVRRNHLYPLP